MRKWLLLACLAPLWYFLPKKSPQPRAQTATKPLFYQEIGTTKLIAEPTRLPASLKEKFTVELAKVSDQSEADQMIKKLTDQGVDAFYTPYQSEGHVYFRVRVGIYDSEELAVNAAQSLGRHLRVKTKAQAL